MKRHEAHEGRVAGDTFRDYLAALVPEIDGALERVLPPSEREPTRLHEAMRYSVFAGGKRLRPCLVVLAGEALGSERSLLLEPAAALELVHTFSLVHDDLPALDDDDLRRGRATLHRRYDEALAILAGDALLDLGLEVMARHPENSSAQVRLANTLALARAIGSGGMIAGQVFDIEAERGQSGASTEVPEVVLERIHRLKTGALLRVSLEVGGRLGGADDKILQSLDRLGDLVGLMFQIRDDILDVEGDAGSLGKTPGKDAQAGKLTYPGLYGTDDSKEKLRRHLEEALVLVDDLPGRRAELRGLVSFIADRKS